MNFSASGIVPEDWRIVGDPGEPAFTDGVEADAGPLAAFGALRFYKGAGRAYVAGVVKITAPGVAFTLPAGYRPEYVVGATAASVNSAMGTYGTAVVAVTVDGEVAVYAADQADVYFTADYRHA